MSLEDLKQMNCMTITPAIAATCLGCDPQWIRLAARQRSASRSAVSGAA